MTVLTSITNARYGQQPCWSELARRPALYRLLARPVPFSLPFLSSLFLIIPLRPLGSPLQAGDTGSLATFSHLFDGVTFRKGLPMTFTATKKGLVTQVDGKEVGGCGRACIASHGMHAVQAGR